jgi:hypothetical protein
MSENWPLHPTPEKTEFLSQWIRRVAKCYGVAYPVFCRKVLHLDGDEIRNLDRQPSAKTLEILSKGTRQPIERLRELAFPEDWLHLEQEIDKAVAEDPGAL